MIDKIKRRIVYKLIIVLVVTVLIGISISVTYFSLENKKRREADFEKSIANIIQIAESGFAAPLWHLDKTTVNELCLSIIRAKEIIGINIFQDSELYVSYSKSSKGIESKRVPFNTKGLIKYKNRIQYNKEPIGELEIYYTKKFIERDIISNIYKLIFAFIFVAIAIIIILYFQINRLLINPILTLSDFSRKVARERKFDNFIQRKSNDEIGRLYLSFNELLMKINQMLKHIRVQEEERKLYAEKLANTKELLNNIIESMPSMLITLDQNGKVTQWNQAATSCTGIKSIDILGENLWEILSMFKKYRPSFEKAVVEKKPILFQKEIFESDSSKEIKNISIYPLTETGFKGAVVRVDDVTTLEKKEEQLRQAQKMETVGTLAGGLAHDFNNVLSGIVGTVSILEHKLGKNQDIPYPELKKYVSTIDYAGNRAKDMVQQLLSLSRKQELHKSRIDLNSVIKNVVKICKNTFDKSIAINVSYYQDKATVFADMTQIEQCILNLAVNSSHAMTIMRDKKEKWGGKLDITIDYIQTDKFFLQSHPEAEPMNYWCLRIADTGVGMDNKTIAKIFDPFFTTKDKGKGTGLGLAMVYNIINQHDGFLDPYSEKGLGTSFNIYLPVVQNSESDKHEKQGTELFHGSGTILIVDDEELVRELAKEILSESGYDVIQAIDGEDGIEKFRDYKDKIDLVLLDMVMPKKSGKEVYKLIKKINPEIKVVLASGFKQDERVTDIMKLGIEEFIQKPYTLHKLSKTVYEVLNPTD